MGTFDIRETRDYWHDKVVSGNAIVSGWLLFVGVVALTQMFVSESVAETMRMLAHLAPAMT